MQKEPLKQICLLFLTVVLGLPFVAIGETEKPSKDQALPWQTSFQEFINEVSRVAALTKSPTAEELESRLYDVVSMSDGGGYDIDMNPPKGTRQWELNRVFSGKSFDWSIPIAKVNGTSLLATSNIETTVVDLDYEKKPTKNFHPPKGVYLEIHGVKDVKEQEDVKVQGTLGKPATISGKHVLSGVCVVNLTERKDGAYELILVLNGGRIMPLAPGAK